MHKLRVTRGRYKSLKSTYHALTPDSLFPLAHKEYEEKKEISKAYPLYLLYYTNAESEGQIK